jgi:hypothetical protein
MNSCVDPNFLFNIKQVIDPIIIIIIIIIILIKFVN